MSTPASTPHLRLVGATGADRSRWAKTRGRQAEVAQENLAASRNPNLAPTDPRWVLAVRAHTELQGSALTPERRQRVLDLAQKLGLRPFDANLVIAIVQDQARRGEDLGDAVGSLAMVAAPPKRSRHREWLRWLAALGTAVVANLLLIRWLLSG